MKLIINETIFKFNNDISSLQDVIDTIENYFSQSEKYLDYIIIDGVEIYYEFEASIAESIDSIQLVEVKEKNKKDLLAELLLTIESYIKRALPEIEHLANEYYQGATSESWNSFTQLLEALNWMYDAILRINESEYTNDGLRVALIQIQKELSNLEEAVKSEDHVSIADIIQYEIMPIINTINESVTKIINEEGLREGVN
ncbi:hypothetical protein CVD28_09270 [Bacillus sp. M6-12]|uniref:hypothetical protein n=1 Tax=Bacillus sp. M6-12 TaxID=2054166 RepID=UPI000C76061A|nr:hypothetical protein [Bacillus sp. M6-12]PLS17874.1 hypothetical protein CVD28_09270 [Bacillus sp. M6-12]